MKNIKLNKKIIIPMIMGALAIGSLTSPVHADPSGADNEYQIIIIEKDPNTGKYVQKITDTFDYIKLYFYEKYETAIGANFATNEEVKIVFYEYLNMLSNNTEELSTSHTLKGTSVFYEMFTNWCEDGEIFRSRAEDKEISESSANRCILLMNHFENKLNDFTIDLDHNISEIEEIIKDEENENYEDNEEEDCL